ncbi:MAG: phospholipase D-like domain-containing protein, partial [Spirochaetales bacterium]
MDIAMFFSRLFFALSFLNYAFVFFLLFFERKDSASRFAWILTLAFLPVLGLLIYILFSGHFFTKTQRMKEAKEHVNEASTTFMENQQDFFEKQAGTFSNPILNEYSSLIDMNLNYANAPITFTDSVKIFTWGKDIFDNLFEDIKNARHYIFLQYFIIRNDQTGQKFINLLCEKAREGVEVKLLYDDLGSFKTPHSLFAQLDKAGGVSLPFFPVKTGNIWSLNFRNHRKIVVIDNKIGYTGGFNIGNEYAGLTDLTWRDTHIRLTGNCIFDLLITFLIDWHAMATGKRTKIKYKGLTERLIPDMYAINKKIFSGLTGKTTVSSKIPTQIISSGPDNQQRTEIKDAMIRMIMNAKKNNLFANTVFYTRSVIF